MIIAADNKECMMKSLVLLTNINKVHVCDDFITCFYILLFIFTCYSIPCYHYRNNWVRHFLIKEKQHKRWMINYGTSTCFIGNTLFSTNVMIVYKSFNTICVKFHQNRPSRLGFRAWTDTQTDRHTDRHTPRQTHTHRQTNSVHHNL